MPSCIVLVNGARAWCLNAVFRCISQEVLAVFGAWAGPARRSERTGRGQDQPYPVRSEEHTSELQSPCNLVCRLLLEKKKKKDSQTYTNLIHTQGPYPTARALLSSSTS